LVEDSATVIKWTTIIIDKPEGRIIKGKNQNVVLRRDFQ